MTATAKTKDGVRPWRAESNERLSQVISFDVGIRDHGQLTNNTQTLGSQNVTGVHSLNKVITNFEMSLPLSPAEDA
jgi:hypothetical protein